VGLIPTRYEENRATRREQTANAIDTDGAANGLGVDDRDTATADSEMVDIRVTTTRNRAIVQQPHAMSI
jgi:hypothetical protein